MSDKERAILLLDAVPEVKIECVIAYMQGIMAGAGAKEPNVDTLVAFSEGDKMLEEGTGQRYTDTKALFADLED